MEPQPPDRAREGGVRRARRVLGQLLAGLGAGAGGRTEMDAWAVLEHLGALVDKSLVAVEGSAADGPRYRLLETTRAFALERLAASGATPRTLRRHAEVTLEIFEHAHRDLMRGMPSADLVQRLTPDLDNLRGALRWAAGADGDDRLAVALFGAAIEGQGPFISSRSAPRRGAGARCCGPGWPSRCPAPSPRVSGSLARSGAAYFRRRKRLTMHGARSRSTRRSATGSAPSAAGRRSRTPALVGGPPRRAAPGVAPGDRAARPDVAAVDPCVVRQHGGHRLFAGWRSGSRAPALHGVPRGLRPHRSRRRAERDGLAGRPRRRGRTGAEGRRAGRCHDRAARGDDAAMERWPGVAHVRDGAHGVGPSRRCRAGLSPVARRARRYYGNGAATLLDAATWLARKERLEDAARVLAYAEAVHESEGRSPRLVARQLRDRLHAELAQRFAADRLARLYEEGRSLSDDAACELTFPSR